MTVFAIITICTALIVNSVVFLIQKNRIRRLQVQTNRSEDQENRFRLFKKDIRVVYLCFGCSVTSILCYLPIVIIRLLSVDRNSKVLSTKIGLTMVISNLNPTADIIFFLCFSKEFRNFYVRSIRTLKSKLSCINAVNPIN